MWPAEKHFRSDFAAGAQPVPGEASIGDHLQGAYHLWLVGHQLENGRAPWLDPYTFQPESSPRVNFGGWPFGLPFWPLVAAFGAVVAWNLFLLLSYLGAGGFTCLWLRELGLPRGAALAGGLAFALGPYRVVQSAGHFRGPISMLIPLALFAFERSRKGTRWWLVLAGAALASIPFSDLHLALGAIPFFLVYALCRTRNLGVLAGAALCVLAGVGAGLLVVGLSVPGSIGSGGRSLTEVAHYSAVGLDFVTRHSRHGPESFVYLGWLTPVLAIAGLVLLVRGKRIGLAVALAIGALVPIVLSLGTHFPLYSTLWHHFPPLRFPRVPERQMPVACLALAALAAVTIAAITRHFPRWATLTYAVVIVALFADLRVSVYRAGRADPDNAAYAALSSEPSGRLLELPVVHPSVHRGSVYLYYDMQAQRERPLGYSTVAPKKTATLALSLESMNCGDWLPGSEARLRRLGVRFIAFHGGLFSGGRDWLAWRALAARGWGPLAKGGGITTLAPGRPPAPPPVPEPTSRIVFCPQWTDRSPRYEHSALWAHGAGRLVMRFATDEPVRTTVTSESVTRSARVVEPVTLSLPLRGPGWHLVNVDVVRADRGLRIADIRLQR
jgi:hypothetical protein